MPVYNNFKEQLLRSTVPDLSLVATEVRVTLHEAYTPDIDAHQLWADVGVSSTEAVGTGYTANGIALATKTVTQDNVTDRAVFDAADVTWTGINLGATHHWIIREVSTGILMCYGAAAVTTNGGDYTLQWSADGILYLG